MTFHELADATWPTVSRSGTVLVPVGATEQHGPHLPLDTDTVIATAVARRLGEELTQDPGHGPVVTAPPVAFGSSGEHQSFAGTASIGTTALTAVLLELTRSLTTWAERVVFVNGHGGNVDALTRATHRARFEGRDVSWVPCSVPGADAHAGYTETSLMLHLSPERVRIELAVAGNTRSLRALMPAMWEGGVEAVSVNGVLGDPAGASAAEGERILRLMTQAALTSLGTSVGAAR